MSILVTGGCGFIGSNFINYFLHNYPEGEIINLDSLSYAANLQNVESLAAKFPKRYNFIQGDICDYGLALSLLTKVDAVFNFAAQTHVDRSLSDGEDFIKSNVLGVNTLLQAAHRAWPDLNAKKFIQVSTDEVYGALPLDIGEAFTETATLNPSSPYSASKAGGDLLILAYYKSFNFPAIITRCTNNFGPQQYPEKLIPLLIFNILQKKPLPIYGDGLNVRDWLYVKDHCKAIMKVYEKGRIGGIYNIAGHNPLSNLELLQKIIEFVSKKLKIPRQEIEKLITFVPDRPGHDRRYNISTSKIEKELNWFPEETFADSLGKTVNWYLEHPEWWQK